MLPVKSKVIESNEVNKPHKYCFSLDGPVLFEPLAKMNCVFFDDINMDVFTVSQAEPYCVVCVQNALPGGSKSLYRFLLEGRIVNAKMSLDHQILSLQIASSRVTFVTFKEHTMDKQFSHISKGKKIIGIAWVTNVDIIIITEHGLERHTVTTSKCRVSSGKSICVSIQWHIYYPSRNFFLLYAGLTTFHPVFVKDNGYNKLKKFEVNPVQSSSILEQNVTVTEVYGQIRILIMQPCQLDGSVTAMEIAVYTLEKVVSKTHILKLPMINANEKFALNVLDDLIIVHHQAAKKSSTFDIGIINYTREIAVHYPVCKASTIKGVSQMCCELYSPNWNTFQPNIIIHVEKGSLWPLRLHEKNFECYFENKCDYVDFYMHRTNGKHFIKSVTKDFLTNQETINDEVENILRRICIGYRDGTYSSGKSVSVSSQDSQSSLSVKVHKPRTHAKVWIDQFEMYSDIFSKIEGFKRSRYLSCLLLEYIKYMASCGLTVQHFIFELLINTLVVRKDFQRLDSCFRFKMISDSKPIACQLLSLGEYYKPAFQLAVDMFMRLPNALQEIAEVLLSKEKVVQAIEFCDSNGISDEIACRKYLEIAQNTNDACLFYSVFVELERRNTDGNYGLGRDSTQCGLLSKYVQHFRELFMDKNL